MHDVLLKKCLLIWLIVLSIAYTGLGTTYVIELSGPKETYLVLGQRVILTCLVKYAGAFSDSIQFYKDHNADQVHDINAGSLYQAKGMCTSVSSLPGYNVLCGSGTNKALSELKEYILTISSINRVHIGKWFCQASSTLRTSNEYRILMSSGPEKIYLNTSSHVTIKEGDDLAVACETSHCTPSCIFQWQHNHQLISKVYILFLVNTKRRWAGRHECTAQNKMSHKKLTTAFILDVQYHTEITALSLNSKKAIRVTVNERTKMTLRCDVDSNPVSKIKLFNHTKRIHTEYDSKSAEYSWAAANCLDGGTYSCEASNRIKEAANRSIDLIVKCTPRVDHRVSTPMHIDAHIGTDTTVVVHVIANPKPTFTWYKVNDDGEKLIGKGSSTVTPNSAVGKLMIRDFKPKDEGTYEVVVSNGNPETNLTVTFMLTITGASINQIMSSVIVSAGIGAALLFGLILVAWYLRKRKKKHSILEEEEIEEAKSEEAKSEEAKSEETDDDIRLYQE